MENTTIEAKNYLERSDKAIGEAVDQGYDIRLSEPEMLTKMVEWANVVSIYKDRTIADLKRQLSECRAKARHGLNPSDKFGI